MKTLVVEKQGNLKILEVAMPEYNECQALVKTVSCGVCNGTDAKLIHRKFKGFPEDVYPITLGHEGVGRVVAVGSKVTSYRVGDVVLLPFAGPFEGIESGWGAFSEYGVVCDAAAWDVAKYGEIPECAFAQTVVPAGIDPVDAAMIITLREVLSSIKRFHIQANDSIAVFGCGPVGLTFIKFLSLLGVRPIIALDIVDEKLSEAKTRGADYVFNSKDASYVERIREICPDGVKFVLDAVGITDIINTAMRMICDTGAICCYGISQNCDMHIDWSQAPYNWKLHFQQFPSKVEEGAAHEQVMEWLHTGVIALKDFISDYCAFADIESAFQKVEERKIAKKCIVYYPED